MKTLYKKASHLRAHTWKDIGGIGGLLLDAVFFVFLFIVSAIVFVMGCMVLVLDYLFSPLLALLTLRRGSPKKYVDESILLDDGTLGTRSSSSAETTKFESLPASKPV